jgi:capsular polysaccharide biosynthesis protein
MTVTLTKLRTEDCATYVSEKSISDAATRIDYIERSEPLASPGSVELGRGFEQHTDVQFFQKCSVTATIRNYRLENIHLDTAAQTLFHQGSKIKEANYLIPPEYYENARVLDNPIKLDASIEYVMARGHPNYYHWLVQTIPAIDWSLRNLSGPRLSLLSGPLNRWQIESMTLLGFDTINYVILDPSHHYFVPALNYSEFQSGRAAFEVSKAAQATFDRLAAAATGFMPSSDIIYIARTDTRNRIVENEQEVIKLLEAEGVNVIVPGRLTVSQQIGLFRRAKAVIGPHGAGLTNVAFCRPKTIFYELMPRHYRNPCFNRLAQAAGLDYLVDLFETIPNSEARPHDQNWIIDSDLLLNRVRNIKQQLALHNPPPAMQRSTAVGPLLTATTGLARDEQQGSRIPLEPAPQAIKSDEAVSERGQVSSKTLVPATERKIQGITADIVAHIRNVGDVVVPSGEWIGRPNSGLWIEGLCMKPHRGLADSEIEYQIVEDFGRLSSLASGGEFRGSRGMSLPIRGLRVCLRHEASERYQCAYTATFADGAIVGPVSAGQLCRSPTLAPLEAFCITFGASARNEGQ